MDDTVVDESLSEVGIGVQFSVQNDGDMIGIHFEAPLTAYVIGFSIAAAERLAELFTGQLRATIAEAKRQRTGLVSASADTLHILKGNQK
jgi:hypothetical protein